jgi:hypothetical protein
MLRLERMSCQACGRANQELVQHSGLSLCDSWTMRYNVLDHVCRAVACSFTWVVLCLLARNGAVSSRSAMRYPLLTRQPHMSVRGH